MLLLAVAVVVFVAVSAFGVTVLELFTDNNERYSGAIERNVG